MDLLIKYLEDLSKRNAGKVWCPTTKVHLFPTEPVIDTKMWAKLYDFDELWLLMSHTLAGPDRKAWEKVLDFFYELYTAHPTMPIAEMIRQYREAGLKPKVCRTALGDVYMPAMKTVLELKKDPKDPSPYSDCCVRCSHGSPGSLRAAL